MSFFIQNTLNDKKEKLIINNNFIKWYVCGPTVYDSPHLGHARTYIYFDTIRRIFQAYGIDVLYAMNITDIDDKIINRAIERGVDYKSISKKYEDEFFQLCDKLNILRPDYVLNVSNYIPSIENFIDQLMKKDIAYESNGSIYFDIKKHLSNGFKYYYQPKGGILEGNGGEKRNREDFALWKAEKKEDMAFDSKYGRGRPGWHIECSTMATDIFDTLDIHSGGVDLKFPHHGNEILQSEAYLNKQWVRYFIHSGHLEIGGQKMSKSLKNFIKIDELLKTRHPRTIRLYFLLSPYDSTMHFDEEGLNFAANLENKIFTFISRAQEMNKKLLPLNDEEKRWIEEFQKIKLNIEIALKDNFNFSKSIRLADKLVDRFNKMAIQENFYRTGAAYLKNLMEILGLNFSTEHSKNEESVLQMTSQFRDSIKRLTKANAEKKDYFKICDDLRESIKSFGYILEDGKDGSVLRKKL